MSSKPFPKWIPQVIILGAVWGLAEAALGLGLEKCASLASGSVMTGVALFFISAAWAVSQSAAGVALAVALVSAIKLFDALLLSLPLGGGAVANPIFAFWTEGLAFLAVFALLQGSLSTKPAGRATGGALAGLTAVNLFPLVKFATGNPACVFPGTQIPLSIHYLPISVVLSAATVPLGLWAGARMGEAAERAAALGPLPAARRLASPAVLVLALLLITFMRFIG
jgi:hypothetical protein